MSTRSPFNRFSSLLIHAHKWIEYIWATIVADHYNLQTKHVQTQSNHTPKIGSWSSLHTLTCNMSRSMCDFGLIEIPLKKKCNQNTRQNVLISLSFWQSTVDCDAHALSPATVKLIHYLRICYSRHKRLRYQTRHIYIRTIEAYHDEYEGGISISYMNCA